MNNYYLIDKTRAVLSVMIVILHSSPITKIDTVNGIIVAFCNLAVPMFFAFSGFFFYNKKLGSFISRLLKLYLFWLIIQFPLLLPRYSGLTITEAIQQTVFSSSYPVSWYLISLLWCGCILKFLEFLKTPHWGILLIAIFLYIMCISDSSYKSIFLETSLYHINNAYKYIFRTIQWSFPQGLLFFCIGYYLRIIKRNIERMTSIYLSICISLIGLTMYGIEYYFISNTIAKDCSVLFSIPFVVYGLFRMILHLCKPTPHSSEGKKLRQISSLMYLSHPMIMAVLYKLFSFIGLARLIWTLLLFIPICYLYFFLLKKKNFSWLKYVC